MSTIKPRRTDEIQLPSLSQFLLPLQLLNGRTLVRLGSAADPLGSAWTSSGPLADPPGVLFGETRADLLRTPPKSAADPKIHRRFAADSPQVRGGAEDLFFKRKFSPLVLANWCLLQTNVRRVPDPLRIHQAHTQVHGGSAANSFLWIRHNC